MDYRFMKNDEKLALIERISQHPDIKDKMLTDINYLKGISGTSMQLSLIHISSRYMTLKKRGHWQKTWKGLLMKNLYSNRIVE